MEHLRERARSLINQHGDAAGEVAKARGLRFRALGDTAEAIMWEHVMDIALEMLAEPPVSNAPLSHGRRVPVEAGRTART